MPYVRYIRRFPCIDSTTLSFPNFVDLTNTNGHVLSINHISTIRKLTETYFRIASIFVQHVRCSWTDTTNIDQSTQTLPNRMLRFYPVSIWLSIIARQRLWKKTIFLFSFDKWVLLIDCFVLTCALTTRRALCAASYFSYNCYHASKTDTKHFTIN